MHARHVIPAATDNEGLVLASLSTSSNAFLPPSVPNTCAAVSISAACTYGVARTIERTAKLTLPRCLTIRCLRGRDFFIKIDFL